MIYCKDGEIECLFCSILRRNCVDENIIDRHHNGISLSREDYRRILSFNEVRNFYIVRSECDQDSLEGGCVDFGCLESCDDCRLFLLWRHPHSDYEEERTKTILEMVFKDGDEYYPYTYAHNVYSAYGINKDAQILVSQALGVSTLELSTKVADYYHN